MSFGRIIGPYGLIVGFGFLLNLAILLAGERAGVHYVVSISISFVSCVLIGYLLHSRFTYATPADWPGLVRYTMAMALNYPLSILAIWCFHDLLSQPMVIAAPASTLALAAYNFFASHWAIVRKTAAG